MGSRIAPPLAILFMNAIESMILTSQNSQYQPVSTCGISMTCSEFGRTDKKKLDEYFKFLNDFHPALRFTIERIDKTCSKSIPFLDTTISVQEDGTYSTELCMPMTAPYSSTSHQRIPSNANVLCSIPNFYVRSVLGPIDKHENGEWLR